MKACKCEHWQQCPVCMPHRFDSNGNLLPPEPTPLQAARIRIEELEREVERLKTTPPDKREDLRCVIYNLCEQVREAEAERDELKAAIKNFLCAWDNCRSSGEWPVRRLEELRAAIAKGEKNEPAN